MFYIPLRYSRGCSCLFFFSTVLKNGEQADKITLWAWSWSSSQARVTSKKCYKDGLTDDYPPSKITNIHWKSKSLRVSLKSISDRTLWRFTRFSEVSSSFKPRALFIFYSSSLQACINKSFTTFSFDLLSWLWTKLVMLKQSTSLSSASLFITGKSVTGQLLIFLSHGCVQWG